MAGDSIRIDVANVQAAGMSDLAATPGWNRWAMAVSRCSRRPLLLAGFILLFQAFPLPSPVRDAATLLPAPGYRLVPEALHLVFTPFTTSSDFLQSLSLREHLVFWVFFGGVAVFLCRGWRKRVFLGVAFLAFVLWATLLPQPAARLVPPDPEILLVEFHSHTNASHDGMWYFTGARNAEWHRRQGFGAGFITDHNAVDASFATFRSSQHDWVRTGYRSLRGVEISLHRLHLGVLGNTFPIDDQPYFRDGDRGTRSFISTMHEAKLPVFLSISEFDKKHLAPGSPKANEKSVRITWKNLLRWGVTGIEIVDGNPVARDFPIAKRLAFVEGAHRANITIVGVSNNHGYRGGTSVWNALRLPGWQTLGPELLEKRILEHLDKEGFQAVRVLERNTMTHTTVPGLLISPVANVVLYFRALSPLQACIWVVWVLAGSSKVATGRLGRLRPTVDAKEEAAPEAADASSSLPAG